MALKKNLFPPTNDKIVETSEVPSVTLEDLKGEHKKLYDNTMAKLSQDLLARFTRTRRGGIKTVGYADDLLDGVDLSTPSEERSMALRQEMNYMISHALLRQSEVLVHLMEGLVGRVVKAVLEGKYAPAGPTFGSDRNERRFYTRPLEQMQISVPEGTRAEYIVYRTEEPNRAPSVYDHPPAFILEGFHCRLRYRPLREGEEVPPCPAIAPNNNKSSDYDLLD